MKEGWEYKKLGEVAEIIGGSTPKTDIADYWNGSHYWVTPAELDGTKYIYSTERTITDEAIQKTNLTLLPEGTVLLSSRAPIGKVCITKVPMFCNQGFKNIICGSILVNEYVYYWLKNNTTYLQSLGTGATFKEISKRVVESIVIPIPPISEQKSIAEELDLLNGIIEKNKAQLEELDKLAQSIFYDMFGDPVTNEKGWEVKRIGEIGEVERGAGISKKDFVEDGLPCIHYGQLHTCLGATTHEHKTCISKDLLPKYKIAHPGDVIMAITSEDVEGSCTSTAWLGDYDIVVGSDAAIFHHSINGVYISYYTRTKAFYNEKAKYAKGFKVTHISTSEIESIPIPLPPLSLQQEFADKVSAIEAMKAKVRQSLAEAEQLFNSRMDYYFN